MKTSMGGCVLALMVAGVSWAALVGEVFAQVGEGSSAGVPSLGMGGSGTASDSAKGTDSMRRDPHSGTLITPHSGERLGGPGIAEQPAGIGEKGSGQTQTTRERSGGQQGSGSPQFQGKAEQALKDLQSRESSSEAASPY
jgi:hypothetical protein